MNAEKHHVLIIGSGILGASIAYHLVRQNVRVTVFDKSPHPASELTGKSFGWIVDNLKKDKALSDFQSQAVNDWRRIEKECKGQLN